MPMVSVLAKGRRNVSFIRRKIWMSDVRKFHVRHFDWHSKIARKMVSFFYQFDWPEMKMADVDDFYINNFSWCSLKFFQKDLWSVLCCVLLWFDTVWWDHIIQGYPHTCTSNLRCTSVGNKIVDHSDAVGASPVGAAPTTSSFST